ncbi:hypothetical protein HanPI659440_Chr01g0020391 [Helianthus annuus]|nr:hypothetical protein HanPI659440_Chr01g0020391 [Helianthus annuus]
MLTRMQTSQRIANNMLRMLSVKEGTYHMQQKRKLLFTKLQCPRTSSILGFQSCNLLLQFINQLLRLGPRRLRSNQLPNRLTLLLMLPLNLTLLKLLLQILNIILCFHYLPINLIIQLIKILLLPNIRINNRLCLHQRKLKRPQLLQESLGKPLAIRIVIRVLLGF